MLSKLTANAIKLVEGYTVKWQKSYYTDIGQDVQFKYVEKSIDKQTFQTQPVSNAVVDGEYRIVQTSDARFDAHTNNFECIADVGDVVYLFGKFWVVDNIDESSVFTPKKQTFYDLAIKRIQNKVMQI